jgi:hypothetical protein
MGKLVFLQQCAVDGCYKGSKKGTQMCEPHQKMYEQGKPLKAFYGKTVRKFVPRYKASTFSTRGRFAAWLKAKTKYEIELEGDQDLVKIFTDELGEILWCEHGSQFYIGRFVDVETHSLLIGKKSFKAGQALRMRDEEKKSWAVLNGLIIKEFKSVTKHKKLN